MIIYSCLRANLAYDIPYLAVVGLVVGEDLSDYITHTLPLLL